MSRYVVAAGDPSAVDVRALLDKHLAFARLASPPEDVHALDLPGLLAESVSFFTVHADGKLLGVGALQHLGRDDAELKSMHTAQAARGRGVGRAMLEHLVGTARDRGYRRLSLETGSMAAFAPARALYASAGFRVCTPFADYSPSPHSVFMTLELAQQG